MAKILLYNGTTNTKVGDTLVKALGELAKYQNVQIKPNPKVSNSKNYNFVQNAIRVAYSPDRNQVDYIKLIEYLAENITPDLKNGFNEVIVLVEEDLFRDNINWCFGGAASVNDGLDYIVQSTARIQDDEQLLHGLVHELGHANGAASKGRKATESNLGNHCINNWCVMRQQLTVQDAVEYVRKFAEKRRKENLPMYCPQCQEDLRKASKL